MLIETTRAIPRAVPYRGAKRKRAAYVVEVARQIAEPSGFPARTLASEPQKTFRRFFFPSTKSAEQVSLGVESSAKLTEIKGLSRAQIIALYIVAAKSELGRKLSKRDAQAMKEIVTRFGLEGLEIADRVRRQRDVDLAFGGRYKLKSDQRRVAYFFMAAIACSLAVIRTCSQCQKLLTGTA